MVISIFGYLFLFIGLLILALPLIIVELSRPRDWLMGGLFLFLGLFLLVENELLRGSINLLVVSMAILFGKMSLEILCILPMSLLYLLILMEKRQMQLCKTYSFIL